MKRRELNISSYIASNHTKHTNLPPAPFEAIYELPRATQHYSSPRKKGLASLTPFRTLWNVVFEKAPALFYRRAYRYRGMASKRLPRELVRNNFPHAS